MIELTQIARRAAAFDDFERAMVNHGRVSDNRRRDLVMALIEAPMAEDDKAKSLALAMGRLSGMQDPVRIMEWWSVASTCKLAMEVGMAQGLKLDPIRMGPDVCREIFEEAATKSGVEMAKLIWERGFAGGHAPGFFACHLVREMFALADYDDLEGDDEMMGLLSNSLSSTPNSGKVEALQALIGMKTMPSQRISRWLDVFFPAGLSEQQASSLVVSIREKTGISPSGMEDVELATRSSIARWGALQLDAVVPSASAKRTSRL